MPLKDVKDRPAASEIRSVETPRIQALFRIQGEQVMGLEALPEDVQKVMAQVVLRQAQLLEDQIGERLKIAILAAVAPALRSGINDPMEVTGLAMEAVFETFRGLVITRAQAHEQQP